MRRTNTIFTIVFKLLSIAYIITISQNGFYYKKSIYNCLSSSKNGFSSFF